MKPAKQLVNVRYFQTNLIFVGKAGAYPLRPTQSVGLLHGLGTQGARVEVTDSEEHSSLS
jgi:hypothetical protein